MVTAPPLFVLLPRKGNERNRFSNRPLEVKRIQTFHSRSVDVAREAALLSGIGTKGPSNMGSEDEVEQSRARPCRE